MSPPPEKIPGTIKNIIQKDQDGLNYLFELEKPPPNLTQAEIKALQALSNNRDLTIKPADKGNMVVIQDRFQYLNLTLSLTCYTLTQP